MSLTASMWTSVSGLLVHGEKMNVVGNNIANVNTVGFKAARMDFEDFISQYIGTAAGMGQVGRGVSIGIVMNDFSQGSFETTTETTDIAVAGNGFFRVKPRNDNTNFYTRAGNFRFDKDGFLVDPHGYVLQGWKIDTEASSLASGGGATGTTGPIIRYGCPKSRFAASTLPDASSAATRADVTGAPSICTCGLTASRYPYSVEHAFSSERAPFSPPVTKLVVPSFFARISRTNASLSSAVSSGAVPGAKRSSPKLMSR